MRHREVVFLVLRHVAYRNYLGGEIYLIEQYRRLRAGRFQQECSRVGLRADGARRASWRHTGS